MSFRSTCQHFNLSCHSLDGFTAFRSRANSLPGANQPKEPWPIRSLELSLPGLFAPWPSRSVNP